MCVLAFAWRAHPRWRIVLAGNRDEHHARPAEPLTRWAAADHLLAGRDLVSGGTWLGVSERGRLAVVTNVRGTGAGQQAHTSRGVLVADLLTGADTIDAIAPDRFNPFNLLVVDHGRATFLANRPRTLRSDLEPGLYGLANATLDTPWPKTLRLKAAVVDWLARDEADPETLLASLREEQPNDAEPIFIRNPVYGTRCSTMVAIDEAGDGIMIERRFAPDGSKTADTALRFSWPATD